MFPVAGNDDRTMIIDEIHEIPKSSNIIQNHVPAEINYRYYSLDISSDKTSQHSRWGDTAQVREASAASTHSMARDVSTTKDGFEQAALSLFGFRVILVNL